MKYQKCITSVTKPMRGWHRLLWGWLGTFPRLAWASEGGWLEPLKVAGSLLEAGMGLLQGGTGLLEPSSGLWQLGAALSEAGASFLEARMGSSRLAYSLVGWPVD